MAFMGKKNLQKEEKKFAQIKPQKYLSNLKKEVSEKVITEVWIQTLQVGSCSVFALYFLLGLVIWTEFKILDWKVTFTVVVTRGKQVQVWWDKSEHWTDSITLPFSVNYSRVLIYCFRFLHLYDNTLK